LSSEESDLVAHTPEITKTYTKTEPTSPQEKVISIKKEIPKVETPPNPPKRNNSQWKDFFFE